MRIWSPTELQWVQPMRTSSSYHVESPEENTLPLESFLLNSLLSTSLNTVGSSPFQRKPFLWPTSLKLCPISLWPFPDQLYKRKALILCLPLLPIPIPQLLLSPFKLSPKITSHLIRVSPKAHLQPSFYFMCLCSKQHCSLSSPSEILFYVVLEIPHSQTLPSVF